MSIKDFDSCKLTNQNTTNYAFENLGILSLSNEAENATLTQGCEMVENTRCDMEDFTFSHDLNEYFKADDNGSFSMDYDVAGDIFPKSEPTSDFLMEDADNSTHACDNVKSSISSAGNKKAGIFQPLILDAQTTLISRD
jgi:hypothetical protein